MIVRPAAQPRLRMRATSDLAGLDARAAHASPRTRAPAQSAARSSTCAVVRPLINKPVNTICGKHGTRRDVRPVRLDRATHRTGAGDPNRIKQLAWLPHAYQQPFQHKLGITAPCRRAARRARDAFRGTSRKRRAIKALACLFAAFQHALQHELGITGITAAAFDAAAHARDARRAPSNRCWSPTAARRPACLAASRAAAREGRPSRPRTRARPPLSDA